MSETEPLYYNYLDCTVTLIGAGGINSHVAPFMARCGPPRLVIWDDDTVEPVNLQVQNFRERDIGRFKAEVVAEEIRAINSKPSVTAVVRKFCAGDRLDGLVMAGVHSMESRHVIFDEVCRQKDSVTRFVDGRLSRKENEWIEIYCIDPCKEEHVDNYRSMLFSDEEAGPPGPRPTKLSAHTPELLTGLIGLTLARLVHDKRHPWKVTLNGPVYSLIPYWGKT